MSALIHWTHHVSSNTSRRVNLCSVTVGKIIFTFGGDYSDAELDVRKPIEISVLDTEKLKWWKLELHKDQDRELVPSHRFGFTAVAQGTKIYLWGGCIDHEVYNSLYCLDTETLKWSVPNVGGNVPLTRDGHSACVINNCMYIFGGYVKNRNELSQDLYKLNLQTMKWSLVETKGNVPSHRDFHTATAIGNKMYIFGGRIIFDRFNRRFNFPTEQYCCEIFYFDTETDTWIYSPTTGLKPMGRRNHSAFVYNGALYIFGGCNKNWRVHFQNINRYDLETSSWRRIRTSGSSMIALRRQIWQLVDGKMFVCDDAGPINLKSSIPRRQQFYDLTKSILNSLIADKDIHILDLNHSLKNICFANLWKYLESNEIHENQLRDLPSSLKNDLLTATPINQNLTILPYSAIFHQ